MCGLGIGGLGFSWECVGNFFCMEQVSRILSFFVVPEQCSVALFNSVPPGHQWFQVQAVHEIPSK